MINSLYRLDAMLGMLHAGFRSGRLPSTIVPGFVDPSAASTLREAVRARLARYDFAPRGRYDREDTHRPEVLLDALGAFARRVTGEPVTAGAVRWMRLRHGDYSLLWDDHLTRPPERCFEATLDLSPATTGQGGTVYTVGEEPLFIAPQLHGSLSLVERRPGLLRYERYLNHLVGAAEVWRLHVALLP